MNSLIQAPLIELNESFIAEVENYASLMFSIEEIASIIEVNPVSLNAIIEDTENLASKAFHRGRLKREAEVRKGIFDLAQNGSSPAQTFAMKLIENAKAGDL